MLRLTARMRTRDAIKRWVEYSKYRRTDRTYNHYKSVLWRFADGAPEKLHHVTAEHIELYLSELLKTCTNRTANAHLTAIKSFCRWAADRYDIRNPAATISMLTEDPPQVRQVLSEDEYQRLLAACEDGEGRVIQFLSNTGLRASEFLGLTWQNISLDQKTLTLVGKGRKRRAIPLNATAQAALPERASNSHIIFSKNLTYRKALWNLLNSVCVRAAVNHASPHDLRHFFATRLKNKGVPIAIISKLLGHSSIRVTELVYVHWLPDDLTGSTDCLD